MRMEKGIESVAISFFPRFGMNRRCYWARIVLNGIRYNIYVLMCRTILNDLANQLGCFDGQPLQPPQSRPMTPELQTVITDSYDPEFL